MILTCCPLAKKVTSVYILVEVLAYAPFTFPQTAISVPASMTMMASVAGFMTNGWDNVWRIPPPAYEARSLPHASSVSLLAALISVFNGQPLIIFNRDCLFIEHDACFVKSENPRVMRDDRMDCMKV
jgi:hypothetical protein